MSALFIRRCWCFGPRPAGQSIFATTAFSQLMMLRECRRTVAKPVSFYLFSISKSVIFFSPVSVRNTYVLQQEEYFILQQKFPVRLASNVQLGK